jgi:hypothetical protein
MDIELEHGTRDPETNVTDDDVAMTAKIARAQSTERTEALGLATDPRVMWWEPFRIADCPGVQSVSATARNTSTRGPVTHSSSVLERVSADSGTRSGRDGTALRDGQLRVGRTRGKAVTRAL